MELSDFNYELPQELIAQDPLEDRASSRLMVLDRETGYFTGWGMIGNITCWAVYTVEDGKIRIINAYSHRMKVEV